MPGAIKKFRDRIAETRAFGPEWRRATIVLIATSLLTTTLLGTRIGAFLEENSFIKPAFRLRLGMGLAPHLDPRIKLVLFEDRALKRLGRQASYDEWRDVAKLLVDAGISRVLFLGFQLSANAPRAPKEPPAGFFAAVVATPDAKNIRAMPVAALLPRLLVASEGAAGTLQLATDVIGPDAQLLEDFTGVGLVNILDDLTVPLGARIDDTTVIPHIGLRAARELRWSDGAFRTEVGRIEESARGSIFVDYVDYREALGAAIGANTFFKKDGIVSELTSKTVGFLKGGEVAVIVPDAFTGTRFIDTPSGLAQSFLAALSVVNSTMRGHFLRAPPKAPSVLAAAWTLVLASVAFRRRRRLDLVILGATFAHGTIGLALILASQLVLPVAMCSTLGLAAAAAAFAVQSLAAAQEKATLRRDLELGQTVQSLLFPRATSGSFGPWRYHVSFRPYGPMSGDWYQTFQTPEDAPQALLVVAIGDVVGKGPSAALCTALIANTWHAMADRWAIAGTNVEEIAAELHRAVRRAFGGHQNTTLSLAVLTPSDAMVVRYGTSAWLHVARDGAVTVRRSKSRDALGLAAEFRAADEVRFSPEDLGDATLVAFTDGVLEGSAARNDFERLLKNGASTKDTEPFTLLETTLSAAGSVSALPDDRTILMVRRDAAPELAHCPAGTQIAV